MSGMRIGITLDVPQDLVDAIVAAAQAFGRLATVLEQLQQRDRPATPPRVAEPAGDDGAAPVAPLPPVHVAEPGVAAPAPTVGGGMAQSEPAAPPTVEVKAKKKRQYSPETLQIMRDNAARMRARKAGKAIAEPPPSASAPVAASVPAEKPDSTPRPPAPPPRAPLADGKPRKADFDTIRIWAGQRGLQFFSAADLDAVNARCARLGLPPFELVTPAMLRGRAA
jgi:hypothetical protein